MELEHVEKGYGSFGKYLREKRKQLKISQDDLARKTKLQRTYLSMLETRGNPSFQTILQITDALGMSLEEFFRSAPLEAREPKIMIQGEMPNPRFSALLIKSRGVPVPIVNNDNPLRSKVITDSDIAGYVVLDEAVAQDISGQKVVAWMNKDMVGVRYAVIDIGDTSAQDGKTYLIDFDGQVRIRRTFLAENSIIMETPYDHHHPVGAFGRQRERVVILGRVIYCAMEL